MPKGALRRVPSPSGGLTPALASLSWELAVPSGLHPAQDSPLWYAGHVSALVPLGADDLLVGTHTGGIWQLRPSSSGGTGWNAVPLSDDWDNPDISAMVVESGDHVYAGCFAVPQSAVRLYEALPGTGGTVWQPVGTTLPTGVDFGTVYGLAVSKGQLVCATTAGLWFTTIPPERTPAGSRGYRWTSASWPAGHDPASGMSGLAVLADGSVVASSLAGGTIWTGQFRTSPLRDPVRPFPLISLVMTQASTPAVTTAARSSLTVCAAEPQRMYAVVGHTHTGTGDNLDGTVAAIWTSADGGRTWTSVTGMVTSRNGVAMSPLPMVDSGLPGAQGDDWNNCIAVSATDQATVVIGWQNGMYITQNATVPGGSATWGQIDWPPPPMHHDLHVLSFETRPTAPGRLYIGSDGGLIATDDLGNSFLDGYSATLADLQFESFPERETYGLTSASSAVAGLLAGGLQDNGVAWAIAGSAGQWAQILGGDGAGTALLADGALLGCSTGDAGVLAVHLWDWNGTEFTGGAIVPLFGPFGPERPTDPSGLTDPALAAVPPTFEHNGLWLYAVGGYGQEQNVVWGLFRSQDGSVSQWERLATLPADQALWSFASVNGTTIYAGVQQQLAGQTSTFVQRIDLTVAPPAITELPQPPPLVPGGDDSGSSPVISRLVVHPSGTLLACYNTITGGQVLSYDMTTGWSQLTSGGIVPPGDYAFGLDVDDFGGIYLATDAGVFFSPAIGGTWSPASAGLPKRPHSSHLFSARTPDGVSLYLSTYGRSVWQAHWPLPALPQAGQGWGWNDLVGNLADGQLYQLGPGGLVPVPGPGGDPASQLAASYAALFTAIGDMTSSVRGVIAAPLADADVAAQIMINQVQATVDRLCQAAAVLTEAAAPAATAGVETAIRVGLASRYITQAAASLTQALPRLPAGMSGTALTESAAALADHVTAMNTLAAAIPRAPAT
jgi:hypothetical protein